MKTRHVAAWGLAAGLGASPIPAGAVSYTYNVVDTSIEEGSI